MYVFWITSIVLGGTMFLMLIIMILVSIAQLLCCALVNICKLMKRGSIRLFNKIFK